MFVIIVVNDTIRILPQNLDKPVGDSVRDEIHAKYSNKVIPDQGLVIALHGFNSRGDAMLYPGDGGAHVRTQFRLVMFRPFVGEIIVGKVKMADHTGMLVSVGFFDHIFIPAENLQSPSTFRKDEADGLWAWNFQGHTLFMDEGEDIRFRVTSVEYSKPKATAAEVKATGAEAKTIVIGAKKEGKEEKKGAPVVIGTFIPPMRVVATIQEDGLGLLSWWQEGTATESETSEESKLEEKGEDPDDT